MPLFSIAQLEELKKKSESSVEPGARRPSVSPIVSQAFPELVKPGAENSEKPAAMEIGEQPVAKTEPVAAPVPVKKKKVIITDMNTGIRKIEYR